MLDGFYFFQSLCDAARTRRVASAMIAAGTVAMTALPAQAAVDITLLQTSSSSSSSTTLSNLPGAGDGNLFPSSRTYDLDYAGGSLRIDRLVTSQNSYAPGARGTVEIRRAQGSNTDIVWQRGSAESNQSDVLLDSHTLPGLAQTLAGNNLLIGGDNVFANRGDQTNNNTNVERLDFIFENGLVVDDSRGFAIFDRGNTNDHDAFQIAAILSVDDNNVPTALGAAMLFQLGDWGNIDLVSDDEYVVLRKDLTSDGNPFRVSNTTQNNIGGVFIPTSDLASAGQTIYGFALIAPDVMGTDLTDWTQYASNTPNDDVDFRGSPYTQPGGGLDPAGVSAQVFEQVVIPEPMHLSGLLLGAFAVFVRRARR